jgi:uncharacterized protein
MEHLEKFKNLKDIISGYNRLAVAFSGGVDSTFLLKAASMVLEDNVIAVTVSAQIHPKWEMEEAKTLAEMIGVKQEIIYADVLNDEKIVSNPPDRCYYCKIKVFSIIKEVAQRYGIYTVADGSNADDIKDYRPGMRALKELGIVSPLREARLTKLEIRALSKELGLPTWDKPALACLATRIPYGERLTVDILSKVDMGEVFLKNLGFKQVRLRHFGNLAKIEVSPEDMKRLLESRDDIVKYLKEIGYSHITMDLEGYRTGSMNIMIEKGVL